MNHGSLFSGIGGFDLASEWMGWNNVFHCEWMPFPRKVLNYHFPNADSYEDICKTDFKKYANTIDILTGGFPCQPFSLAGKRKGKDDERYLWGEMLRAIQEIKPKFVIGENVFGITSIDGGLVFEQVCVDLETEGYEVQPFVIPACAKNAPHRRDRVWFIATKQKCKFGFESCSNKQLCESCEEGSNYELWDATNTNSIRFKQCECDNEVNTSERGFYALNDIGQNVRQGIVTDTCKIRLQHKMENGELGREQRFIISNKRQTWDTFPSQSPICGGDDGLPTQLDGITFPKWRAESIKGYGNAIVPQVAYEIFKVIEQLHYDTIPR